MNNPSTASRQPIVLGAGVAGISAAVELARRGERPILLESRPYIGGRVRSFVHEPSGDEIDNGQHLMMGCYTATLDLLQTLGTRHLVSIEPRLDVEFRSTDGTIDRLRTAPLPAPIGTLVGISRMRSLTWRDRRRLLTLGIALRTNPPRPYETAADFFSRTGQTQTLRRWLWDPLVVATLNAPPEQVSGELFAAVMKLAFLSGGTNSHLAFAQCGLSHLFAPARQYITERGGIVLTSTTVTRVAYDGTMFTLDLKDSTSLHTTQLTTALPPHSLAIILHGNELRNALLPPIMPQHSPIVSLYLWYDAPLDRVPKFCALVGSHTQWLFNRRRIDIASPQSRYPGLLSCTISAAAEEITNNAATLAQMVDAELRQLLPEIGDAHIIDSLVLKEKHATPLITPEFERLRWSGETTIAGLYRVGDWTAQGLPATIEGAVRSGVPIRS